MTDIEDQILVNQWVQNAVATSVLTGWYESLTDERKSEITNLLAEFCRQARFLTEDGMKAVEASGVNPRRTAAVLLGKGASKVTVAKLTKLGRPEQFDVFVLLLHLLRIADTRRRMNETRERCNHWWHQDLSDPNVAKRIRDEYKRGMLGVRLK